MMAKDGRIQWFERLDAQGNRAEAGYFNEAGQPMPYRGHLRTEASYDETGRISKAVYLIPRGDGELSQKPFVFSGRKTPQIRFESVDPDGSMAINEAYLRVAVTEVRIRKRVVGIGTEVKFEISGAGENLFDLGRGILVASKVITNVVQHIGGKVEESITQVRLELESS